MYSCQKNLSFQKRKLPRASWYCLWPLLDIKQTEYTSLKFKLLHIPNKKHTFYECYKALNMLIYLCLCLLFILFCSNVYVILFKYHLGSFFKNATFDLNKQLSISNMLQLNFRVCFLCPFKVCFDPKPTQGWHWADQEGT